MEVLLVCFIINFYGVLYYVWVINWVIKLSAKEQNITNLNKNVNMFHISAKSMIICKPLWKLIMDFFFKRILSINLGMTLEYLSIIIIIKETWLE